MKIIVLGDSISICLAGLKALLKEGGEIMACVLSLKSKNNTEKNLNFHNIKKLLQSHNIPVIFIEDINNCDILREIKRSNPDIIFNLFNTQILKSQILSIPNKGCINFHHSLLPKYAGLNPCTWALINGETYHGVTTHYIDEGVDTGDIISQISFEIDSNDTALTLFQKCISHTGKLIEDTMRKIKKNHFVAVKQDLSKRSYYGKGIPYGGVINFCWSAQRINNFIRAFDFWPYISSIETPFTFYKGRKIKVLRSSVSEICNQKEKALAMVLEFLNGSVLVNTALKTILIESILEEKEMVSAFDYFKKNNIIVGNILGW